MKVASRPSSDSSLLENPQALYTAAGWAFLALSVICSFVPSGINWGFHWGAFLDPFSAGLLIALAVIALPPSLRNYLTGAIQHSAQRFTELSNAKKRIFAGLCLAFLISLFWQMREATHFLGDGYLMLRSFAPGKPEVELAHEPLFGWLVKMIRTLLPASEQNPGVRTFQLLSIASGGMFFLLVLWHSRLNSKDTSTSFLLTLFLLSTAGSQLFFGHIENYAPSYTGLFAFIVAALNFLDGKTRLWIPTLIFAALLPLNLATVVYLPLWLLLAAESGHRGDWRDLAVSVTIFLAVAGLAFGLSGYSLQEATLLFAQRHQHVLPLSGPLNDHQSYSLFSVWHLVDFLNFLVFYNPFLIPLVGVALVVYGTSTDKSSPRSFFLIGLLVLSLVFPFILNSDLGLNRDWDLLALFGLGAIVSAIHLALRIRPRSTVHTSVIALMALLSFAHVFAVVSVHSRESSSLKRLDVLPDARVWGVFARCNLDEERALFYRDRRDIERSLTYLEDFVSLDSSNTRIWMKVGNAYREIGEYQNARRAYERALELNPKDGFLWYNLATLHWSVHDTTRTFECLQRSVATNIPAIEPYLTLGIFMIQVRQDYRSAIPMLERVLSLQPLNAEAQEGLTLCRKRLRMEGK